MARITEGYMPFMGHETYYRIVGERRNNGKAPLLCLHGVRPAVERQHKEVHRKAEEYDGVGRIIHVPVRYYKNNLKK